MLECRNRLKDLIVKLPGGLEHYLPSLKYLILDEGRYANEAVLPLKNLVAAIFRLENSTSDTEINDLVEIKTMLADRIPQWIREGELRGEARGEARGEVRGEVRGEANMLLKLLNLKFGTLPDWVELQVNSADKEQLDCWAKQVLTANALEELFS